MKPITALGILAIMTLAIVPGLHAQSASGELIFSADATAGGAGQLYICPTVTVPQCYPYAMSAPLFPRSHPNGFPGFKRVINGEDNMSFLAIWDSNQDYLVRHDATGYSTLATLDTTSGLYTNYDLVLDDQDGCALVALGSAARNVLLRVDLATRQSSTLATFPTRCWGVLLDDDANEVYAITQGGLIQVDRRTGRQTTMCTRAFRDVDHDQGTGHFVAVDGRDLLIMDSSCNVLHSAFVRAATEVHVDDPTGSIYVASGSLRRLAMFDRNARNVWSCTTPNLSVTGITIRGQRKVSGRFDSSSRTYRVEGRFLQSPNCRYAGALSIGLRPGVGSPTSGALYLNWTCPLFALTASRRLDGIMLFGFRGTTDATGGFRATVRVPAGTPRGLRVHVGFWAENAAAFPRTGLDVSESIVFTTE